MTYQNCAPINPFFSLGMSVWDQGDVLYGTVSSRPSLRFRYSKRLCENRFMFHGKSLWPSGDDIGDERGSSKVHGHEDEIDKVDGE